MTQVLRSLLWSMASTPRNFGTRTELSLKAAINLPILVKGVNWIKIQIDDQVVERVVVTFGPVSSVVPIVLGMNDLRRLLGKFEHSDQHAQGFGL